LSSSIGMSTRCRSRRPAPIVARTPRRRRRAARRLSSPGHPEERGEMSDAQRGNTTHGPNLDDQLKQESRGMVQGHGAPHAEPFRETEPLPDDTDSPEVQAAFEREDPHLDETADDEEVR